MKRKPPKNGLDLDTVRELARIAEEFNLAEVETDPSGHVRVRRAGVAEAAQASPPHPTGASVRAISLAPSPPAQESASADAGIFISSPFVGTFYSAPSPEAATFVEIGQQVRKGQVVCIVEAMKLMNEIEAEVDGKVAEVLANNGEHVEYGQHLFRLTRS
jgi:acetyl-CoA carboxylase biotin carboxyl carrier protein